MTNVPVLSTAGEPRLSIANGLVIPIPTLPLNTVVPDTFNDDLHVVALFNVVLPDIFNVDINVEGLIKLTNEGGFNIEL